MTIEKILTQQCQEGKLRVDCFVLNNAKALAAVGIIEKTQQKLARPEAVYVIEDQVVPANDPAVSEGQQKMLAFAKRQGTEYAYGQAMASHYLADGVVKAGDVVVSADEDIFMVGAVGALGICLCPAKLAQALVTGNAEIAKPKAYRVKLAQKLPEGVDVRDAAKVLVEAIKPYVKPETVIEFSGTNDNLSCTEKMVLCGWCQKLGVMSALFVEDNAAADYVLELGKVVSLGAPQEEKEVTVVYIGGAYGGTLEAVKTVAEAVKGKQVSYKVRLNIAPATATVYAAAASAGYFTDVLEAGGMVLNQCALPPVQSRVGVGEVMVSNDIHDEQDYAGKDGIIYLTSTQTAVQAALTGKIGGEQ